jgi:integrase
MSRRRTAPAPRRFDSGRWQARVRDPLTNRLVGIGTFDTKAEAENAQVLAMADQQRGSWRPPEAGRQTFGYWAKRYLATTAHLRPKTKANYESTLKCHLLPELADVELRRLDRPSVRAFLARMTDRGTATGTVERVRAVMRNVLNAAIEGGAIVTNPADRVKIPRTMRKEEPVFLVPDEVEALAQAVTNPPRPTRHPQRHYPDLGLLIRLTAYTGLRSSEVAALRVGRVDLFRRRLEVAEAATEGRGGLQFGPTKNYQRRTVPLPGFLADELTLFLAGRRPDELVFAAPEGGPFRHGNFYVRHFKPAVIRAGVPPKTRFHDLRHTYASRLIAEGATALTVMRRLGHSSIKVTYDTYGHLLPEQEEALTDRLDIIGRAARPTAPATVAKLRQAPKTASRSHR